MRKLWEIVINDDAGPDVVRRLYSQILGRAPDEEAYRSYSTTSIRELFNILIESEEFQHRASSPFYYQYRVDRRPRILLFGAYGNGNLGDAIQAQTMSSLISRIEPSAEIWACSLLPAPFPFLYDRILPSSEIWNHSTLACFDMIIIGGGGLLSHPHPPLSDESWQSSLNAPVAIFGVGADLEVAKQSSVLLAKAVFVSARDPSSLNCLRQLVNDVHFIPDPVLCSEVPMGVEASGPKSVVNRKLWILRAETLQPQTNLDNLIGTHDVVCFLEPGADFVLISRYPQARPIYDLDHLITLIDEVDVVISMRFHGLILSLLRGKPCLGIHENKSLELLSHYGNQDFFRADFNDFVFPDWSGFKPASAQQRSDSELARGALETILRAGANKRKLDAAI